MDMAKLYKMNDTLGEMGAVVKCRIVSLLHSVQEIVNNTYVIQYDQVVRNIV